MTIYVDSSRSDKKEIITWIEENIPSATTIKFYSHIPNNLNVLLTLLPSLNNQVNCNLYIEPKTDEDCILLEMTFDKLSKLND